MRMLNFKLKEENLDLYETLLVFWIAIMYSIYIFLRMIITITITIIEIIIWICIICMFIIIIYYVESKIKKLIGRSKFRLQYKYFLFGILTVLFYCSIISIFLFVINVISLTTNEFIVWVCIFGICGLRFVGLYILQIHVKHMNVSTMYKGSLRKFEKIKKKLSKKEESKIDSYVSFKLSKECSFCKNVGYKCLICKVNKKLCDSSAEKGLISQYKDYFSKEETIEYLDIIISSIKEEI